MSVKDFIEKGGTIVIDPTEFTQTPDEFLLEYGNIVDTICIMAKSETGSTFFSSSNAPKDQRYGEVFSSFAQIATDIGIRVYGLVQGNLDGFFSRDPNFQMYKSGGNPIINYVCPNQETYWAYLAEICAEIVNRIPIEGIILKDVVYPRENTCFCENCKRNFSSIAKIDRDFSFEQIRRNEARVDLWNQSRVDAIRGLYSTVINRIHQERKIEVLTELCIDPEIQFLQGARAQLGQDIASLSQISSHVLLHFYPWSNYPTTQEELDTLITEIAPITDRIGELKTSFYMWQPDEMSFEIFNSLKEKIGSKFLFFTENQPKSYLDRRSLHLDLGV
ncbi:MAG: hypothetical protein OEY49_00600 [Candidatus Heimdallarchaeota archaeon]|nr:hypothetical protein [Candidatus Heimdallarchaeota archaeon]